MNVISEITELDWEKDWEGKLSLLLVSLGLPGYLEPLQKETGFGLGHFLVLQEEGISAGYWVTGELDDFGEKVSQLAQKRPAVLSQWSDRLKQETDRCKEILKQDPKTLMTPERFRELRDADEAFTLYQLLVRRSIDYLPQDILTKYESELESARKYCETIFYDLESFVSTLSEQIASDTGTRSGLVMCLSASELEEYFKAGTLPYNINLEERYRRSGLYLSTDLASLSPEEVEKIKQAFSEKADGATLTGQVARQGSAQGKVRVIKKYEEAGEFNEGDVLVTGMTDPNYLPIMKKAAAIVTDAGGVLSHAAIVSRELGIPCIIGTQHATEVLKDGDDVEVDADNGMVRRIK